VSARGRVRVLLIAALTVLAGCGGGEQSANEIAGGWDDESDAPPNITIATPSITGFYVTTADHVHIAGTTSEWDAEIQWDNDAGYEGKTSPEYEMCWRCRYDWSADVPLAMGENEVTIVIKNDDGEGQAMIHITRQAAWSWTASPSSVAYR